MSSKRITIVLGTLLIAVIGYFGYQDAVRTWQTLQEQQSTINTLNQEYDALNNELDETQETKQKSQEEVDRLEQEKRDLEQKRQELEKQLQTSIHSSAVFAVTQKNGGLM